MKIFQLNPSQIETAAHGNEVNDYLMTMNGDADMQATRYQLERLPSDLRVVSGVKVVVPALVYLPNKHDTPPSLALGEPSDLNSEFLHSRLKSKVRDSQKDRLFRNAPVTSGMMVDDGSGRHLFLDDDSEEAVKFVTPENADLFKKIYDIEHISAGDEFGNAGLSLVGLVRVIGGARKKAQLKQESENALVDRFLLEVFAALARNGKSADVYHSLVQENSRLKKSK